MGNELQRLVQRGGLLIELTGAQAKVDAALLSLDVERAGPGKSSGQLLRAAHAAQSGGQHPTPFQRPAKSLAPGLDNALIRALYLTIIQIP